MERDKIVNSTRASFIRLDDDGGHARKQVSLDVFNEVGVHRGHQGVGAQAGSCAQSCTKCRSWRATQQSNQQSRGGADSRSKEGAFFAFE